jgi:putative salt-induced outer membrane protein YdiY
VAITGGNSDTTNFNVAVSVLYDPKVRDLFKLDGLYLRGEADSRTTVDKTTFALRYERKISDRLFAFGQVSYMRDRFKDVDYLISPIVGAGYHVVKTDRILLSFDAGVGGAFEKNPGLGKRSSGAVQAGEAFAWKISPTATLSQKANGLWKTNDFADCFYHFEVGVAASVAKRLELKVSFLLDYKNRPTDPRLDKTDTAFVAALVVKL